MSLVRELMKRDDLFQGKDIGSCGFRFDGRVAEVFDDMVLRSVPIYREVHKIIRDIVRRYFPQEGVVYDLGCSTGTTIVHLAEQFELDGKRAKIIGVDSSHSMLAKCRDKLEQNGVRCSILIGEDIGAVEMEDCDLVIMNYTLQFIDPRLRGRLLKKIYSSLKTGGIFFLSEKISSKYPTIDKILADLYRDFKKRNGYSDLEIARKRDALENVLIPLTPKEQVDMMRKAGFQSVEPVFRWYNFASYLGIK